MKGVLHKSFLLFHELATVCRPCLAGKKHSVHPKSVSYLDRPSDLRGWSPPMLAASVRTSAQWPPCGAGKTRADENLTKDTPPKKGFWTPLRLARFNPPLDVIALFLLYKNPGLSRPEAPSEGSRNVCEGAFSGTSSFPYTFCSPPSPYHGPIRNVRVAPLQNQIDPKGLYVQHRNSRNMPRNMPRNVLEKW